jgi:hypothetical protein
VTIGVIILLGILAWGMIALVEMVRGRLSDADNDKALASDTEDTNLALVIALSPEKKQDDNKSH